MMKIKKTSLLILFVIIWKVTICQTYIFSYDQNGNENIKSQLGGSKSFVNLNASGNQTGSDWKNAFFLLQKAFDFANTCPETKEIWVAAGEYVPTAPLVFGRDLYFELPDSVAIYGGFQGWEYDLNLRNSSNNETILSGDLGIQGDGSDNVYHVIKTSTETKAAVLDGVIIEKGNADGFDETGVGGGIYSQGELELRNVIIRNCSASLGGGGIFNSGVNAILTLNNVILELNSSGTGDIIKNEDGGEVNIEGSVEVKN